MNGEPTMLSNFCSALIGIIITMAITWAAHMRNAVTREEFEAKLDKKADEINRAFFGALKANNSIMTDLSGQVKELAKQVAVLVDREERE